MSYPNPPASPPEVPTCYRHPGRATYVQCTRCRRFMCPDCMRVAAVGHQCVDCVNDGAKSIRQATTQFGGRPAAQPYVTYVLIAVNVAMFIAEKANPDVYRELVLWPRGIAFSDEVWRLAGSGFLHAGITHLLLNMVTLYFMGPALERALGHIRFIALYLVSLLGGSALVYLLTSLDTPTLGASGALYGLFGAAFVLGRKMNFDMRFMVALIAVNLVITFVAPGISWQGHIGGLITGAVIGAAYGYAPRAHRTLVHAGVLVGLLVVIAAVVWLRTASLVTLGYGY